VSQRLAVVAVELESLERSRTRLGRARMAVRRTSRLVAQLADDVHRLAFALHPRVLEDLGLPLALETFLRDLGKRYGINARMRARGVRVLIPREHALCLYRVAQEALRNATRHGGALDVTLTLTQVRGAVALCVKDAGKGFSRDAASGERRGLGLVTMEERVRLLDGRLVVRSRPGRGTHVHVWVPLPASKEAIA
jgi:signal transduction histidine kinase